MIQKRFHQTERHIIICVILKIALGILFIYIPTILCGKDLSGRYKYLSLGPKHCGICFGTPKEYNGIRLNLWDRKDAQINGLSISGWSKNKKTNGISLGIIATNDDVSNGIEISGIAAQSSNSNGIKIGGLGVGAKTHNGLAIGNLWISGKKFNGIGVSLFGSIGSDILNGLFISCWGIGSTKVINGFAVGGFNVFANSLNGASLSVGMNLNDYQKGVSITTFNFSNELHGFQFGLINYAGNNRRLFRVTPIVNFHLKKKNYR